MIEVKVPDIGDFKDVPVIELLVKVGDIVQPDTPLMTLESDKATIDVPAPQAGKIQAIHIKVGDKVNEGSLIATLEPVTPSNPVSEKQVDPSKVASPKTEQPVPTQTNVPSKIDNAISCQLLVLGAGPGGYSAAFRAADLGMKVILVDKESTLGGVCLNVGCIPSKALLHTTSVMEEAINLKGHGISFAKPVVDLDQLRSYKEKVVSKLTSGLAAMAKMRQVQVIQGVGQFLDSKHLQVQTATGAQTIYFEKAIIAAGSEPVPLPFMPKSPRVVDSTGALSLPFIPKRMLVIGGGIIGMEMATVYSALGTRVDVVEMMSGLMMGADRDLVKVWEKKNTHRFDHLWLNTKTVSAQAQGEHILVQFEGSDAPKEPQAYDLVLVAVGRKPNGLLLGLDKAGVQVNERGFISVDNQMRTNIEHIFAIGDIVGQPMLAHKAVHEGHVAAQAAFGQKSFFEPKQIPSVAYTDPEIAWAGLTEEQCQTQEISYTKGLFPWSASGRAIANGRDEGFTKLLFDKQTHRIIGGGIVGTHAGDLIGEVCLAIEMGADAVDIGKTIHPHPTLGESLGMAAEAAEGTCTDLPPTKKRT
jgi:dihydrolipoamide dehydrogenase